MLRLAAPSHCRDNRSCEQVLRLLRLVRLIRLVRILKTAELFKRWESQIAVSYSHLKLIRFSVAVLLSAHWLACGFYLVAVLEDQPVSLFCLCNSPSCMCQSMIYTFLLCRPCNVIPLRRQRCPGFFRCHSSWLYCSWQLCISLFPSSGCRPEVNEPQVVRVCLQLSHQAVVIWRAA